MLNRVGENRSAVLGLATIKNYDEYTSFHSVNVLILSLALGSMLPLDRSSLMILGTGALLHDLGKITVPQSLLVKTGPLTTTEWRMMQEHPARGADILLAQPGVHPLAVMVAYEHHARYDLNGYPKIHGKDRIGLFSRIVEVADVYDAMTSARPYQKARMPDQAMRVLVKDMGSCFDPLLVKVFIDMMGLFPVGTPVRLATGEVGVVYEPDQSDALWPRVKVILDPDGGEVEPSIVDLHKLKEKIGETEQPLLESIHPEDLGIDIREYL
jgi:HD-GYP domain-containing protein (c-di-GMP phosphodiesterase class II)